MKILQNRKICCRAALFAFVRLSTFGSRDTCRLSALGFVSVFFCFPLLDAHYMDIHMVDIQYAYIPTLFSSIISNMKMNLDEHSRRVLSTAANSKKNVFKKIVLFFCYVLG